MNRAEEKAQRLLQIEKLLWAHPEGLTRAEIARRLGVNRSTITKYLDADQLPPGIYDDDLDGNKLKMDRNADLTKASLSLHEVLAIHLATRGDKQRKLEGCAGCTVMAAAETAYGNQSSGLTQRKSFCLYAKNVLFLRIGVSHVESSKQISTTDDVIKRSTQSSSGLVLISGPNTARFLRFTLDSFSSQQRRS
jgi:ParB-like chromosome segregation protein Spo0J